jgi:hypothetical protein
MNKSIITALRCGSIVSSGETDCFQNSSKKRFTSVSKWRTIVLKLREEE